jgi:ABC-type glutathione transport system ATPase component
MIIGKTQTIIGVIGNSGVGKSSLINALLNQPSLVPVSSNHSCTAVVTRISYGDGHCDYSGEIEYFTAEEWLSELRVIRHAIIHRTDEKDISKAKLKAVYPGLSIENINVDDLLDKDRVKIKLGGKYYIYINELSGFSKSIRCYVKSGQDNASQTARGFLLTRLNTSP